MSGSSSKAVAVVPLWFGWSNWLGRRWVQRGLGRMGLRWTHSCPREARGCAVAVSQRGKATERLGKVKRATGRIIWLPRTGGGTIGCA